MNKISIIALIIMPFTALTLNVQAAPQTVLPDRTNEFIANNAEHKIIPVLTKKQRYKMKKKAAAEKKKRRTEEMKSHKEEIEKKRREALAAAEASKPCYLKTIIPQGCPITWEGISKRIEQNASKPSKPGDQRNRRSKWGR